MIEVGEREGGRDRVIEISRKVERRSKKRKGGGGWGKNQGCVEAEINLSSSRSELDQIEEQDKETQ